jgi:hypothetical protein
MFKTNVHYECTQKHDNFYHLHKNVFCVVYRNGKTCICVVDMSKSQKNIDFFGTIEIYKSLTNAFVDVF